MNWRGQLSRLWCTAFDQSYTTPIALISVCVEAIQEANGIGEDTAIDDDDVSK